MVPSAAHRKSIKPESHHKQEAPQLLPEYRATYSNCLSSPRLMICFLALLVCFVGSTIGVTVVDTYFAGGLILQLLKETSSCAQHPTVTLNAPPGTVILGGGADVDWTDGPCAPPAPPGNMLTAMYPNADGTCWTVASKDHLLVNTAQITAYAIVAKMWDGSPISSADYQIFSGTSGVAAHPTVQVNVPSEFVVVGGGARVNYNGVGSMLYGSYPTAGLGGWVGSAKDHLYSDPSEITVWAIGLRRSFLKQNGLTAQSSASTSSPPASHPSETQVIPNFLLTGVGARVNWNGVGNLLTASYPADHQTVVTKGKDHLVGDPSTITAYAIGFQGL